MIGVDWGTTRLRAFRIDSSGAILAARSADKGILSVSNGDFADALETVIADWLDEERAPVLMSGMIGSRQGWVEAAYVPCPAAPADIASHLSEVRWGKRRVGLICPGLTCHDRDGVPDVMRGEEVQAFGALALLDEHAMAICHPGTHSKHIDVAEERVAGFTTFMTGEVFAILSEHSILGRTMTRGPVDWQAFDEGIVRAQHGGGLLHHLFGARTRVLMDTLSSASEADHLSGILIGHEIASAEATASVTIVGAADLAERYQRGFRTSGRLARVVDGDQATAAGLRRIWNLAEPGRG